MRQISSVIIHSSATMPNMDIGYDEIYDWHVNGNNWRDIGYHYIIRRNGQVERGRSIKEIGAHTKGFNAFSIGICVVGGINKKGQADVNFTRAQWNMLDALTNELVLLYDLKIVKGHRDYANTKCPGFDVQSWWRNK